MAWTTADAKTWTNPEAIGCGCEGGICQNTVDGLNDGINCLVCEAEPDGTCQNGVCHEGPTPGASCLSDLDCCSRVPDPSICGCPDPNLEDPSDPDPDTDTLRPTPSDFVFPIIMHMADTGALTLLTEVTMLFEPNEPGSDTGRFILATPGCENCEELEATEMRGGQPFARRVSTAGYAFDGDGDLAMNLSGTFGDADSTMTAVIVLQPNSALNPFRHSYHPDHDCDNLGECYKITRTMEFTFGSERLPGDTGAGFGFSLLSGEYLETITISAAPDTTVRCGCGDASFCVAGVNDGVPCETDSDCSGGTCTATTVCVGEGPNDGTYCEDDCACACPGFCGCCWVARCVDGADDGNPCEVHSDCSDPGVCELVSECVGGPSEGGLCQDDFDCDCVAPECFCDLQTSKCSGEANAGRSCYADEHCGCGDKRLYTTQAGGTFRLNRVSEIERLNDVSGN